MVIASLWDFRSFRSLTLTTKIIYFKKSPLGLFFSVNEREILFTFLLIVLAFVLVLLNGFFVAAEFAIVKLRGTRLEAIKSQHGFSGRILQIIHRHLDEYLSACQLGITLASLGLGWIGEPAFANLFERLLINQAVSHALATIIAFSLAFFMISYLHIVVGELAPKSIAIRKVEKVALWTAVPLYLFYKLMYPAIWLLNASALIILKFFGVKENHKENIYSIKELKVILNASHMHEDLTKDELQILDRVLEFTDLSIGDIMRPIHEMKSVYADQPIEETLNTIARYHLSRYPIYTNSDEAEIIGVLHIKDILEYIMQHKTIPKIDTLKRPIIVTELNALAIEVFHQFRGGHGHFAIVKNEFGKCVGFITLDDILSVALGNIRDEFVKPHRDWFITKEGHYVMYGYTPLYTLERLLKIEILGESNTIGGLLLSELRRMPEQNEMIHFKHFDVQVLKIKGPRIELVKIFPTKKAALHHG